MQSLMNTASSFQAGISAVEIAKKIQDRHQAFIIKYPDHYALVCEKNHICIMQMATHAVVGMLALHYITNMR